MRVPSFVALYWRAIDLEARLERLAVGLERFNTSFDVASLDLRVFSQGTCFTGVARQSSPGCASAADEVQRLARRLRPGPG